MGVHLFAYIIKIRLEYAETRRYNYTRYVNCPMTSLTNYRYVLSASPYSSYTGAYSSIN